MDINAKAVRVFSVIGIVIHGLLFAFCVFLGGLSDGPSPNASGTLMVPIISLPLFYFVFCYVSSLPRYSGRPLFVAGIVMHLLILFPYYQLIRQGAFLFVALPLLTAPCWLLTWKSRLTKNEA